MILKNGGKHEQIHCCNQLEVKRSVSEKASDEDTLQMMLQSFKNSVSVSCKPCFTRKRKELKGPVNVAPKGSAKLGDKF